jgi:hypothetical protein
MPPSSPSDYSSTKGSFSHQVSEQPTSAREALEPQTESHGGSEGSTGLASAPTPASSPTQALAPSPWDALRSTAKSMGVDLPQDDQAALHALVSAYQNAGRRDYYTELGAAIAPQYGQFQAWQQQQEAVRAAQQRPEQASPWSPPAFDQNWLRVVEEDPQTGRFRSKQGYDPRIGEACQAYADYIGSEQRSLWENPPAWIARMIGPTVQEMIHQGIQGSFQGYQEQVQANSIIQRNMGWLYNKDQNGNVLLSQQTGRPQLSPHGTRYYQYVEQAANWGVTDINQQHDYAMGMVERDALRGQYMSSQTQAQIPASASYASNVNSPQTMVPPSRQNVQPSSQSHTGLSLAEMLRQDFKNEGITDQQIRADMMTGVQ